MRNGDYEEKMFFLNEDNQLNESLNVFECRNYARYLANKFDLEFNDDVVIGDYGKLREMNYVYKLLSKKMPCKPVKECRPDQFYYIILLIDGCEY